MRKKFAVVFGTRPEAIKLAPVIRELERCEQDVVRISTGQHLSMLWQALDFFEIAIDYDLGAMHEGQSLPQLFARIMTDCEAVLRKEAPDVVIVQGDTATALAGGLSAYLLRQDVAHIEAGLRTCDDRNPFPEEMNRAMVARLARWHFAPTAGAKTNLVAEGIDDARVHITGNTIVDALDMALAKCQKEAPLSREELASKIDVDPEMLQRFILVTSHRRENLGPALKDICRAICQLERDRSDISIVWPVHLNPDVRAEVEQGLVSCGSRLFCVEPLDYQVMLGLLNSCEFILTDSGGIQEEAVVFHKPVLIMRKATERPEILHCGGGLLVGTSAQAITKAANDLLDDPEMYQRMASAPNPFGDGHAAERIVRVLLQ
ncbi:MAG TPA: UDP-N-acetylglucosamine 2-epimerase (non-hydrolyzing) [Thermoanaerobaculia bacterium]